MTKELIAEAQRVYPDTDTSVDRHGVRGFMYHIDENSKNMDKREIFIEGGSYVLSSFQSEMEKECIAFVNWMHENKITTVSDQAFPGISHRYKGNTSAHWSTLALYQKFKQNQEGGK